MSFQRRHYEEIASVISARHANIVEVIDNHTTSEVSDTERRYDLGYCHGIENLAGRLADMFDRDNPQFDRARFLKACGVEP